MSKWEAMSKFEYDDELDLKVLKNFLDIFEIVDKLGEGAYGNVYLVQTVCDDKPCSYALKILKEVNDRKIIDREIINIQEISKFPHCHPSFICFYDAFCFTIPYDEEENEPTAANQSAADDTPPRTEMFFVGILTEFIDGYTLKDYYDNMKTLNNPIKYEFVGLIAEWLLYSISILHGRGIMHRDIKPSNIMITKSNQLKLLDFGLSCHTDDEPDTRIKKILCGGSSGTPGYVAPEIYSSQYQYNKKKYYRTADAFSIGATLYYLLTNKTPYIFLADKKTNKGKEQQTPSQKAEEIKIKLKNNEIQWIYRPLPAHVPAEITYIVEKLLLNNPDERMNITDAYRAFRKYNLKSNV